MPQVSSQSENSTLQPFDNLRETSYIFGRPPVVNIPPSCLEIILSERPWNHEDKNTSLTSRRGIITDMAHTQT